KSGERTTDELIRVEKMYVKASTGSGARPFPESAWKLRIDWPWSTYRHYLLNRPGPVRIAPSDSVMVRPGSLQQSDANPMSVEVWVSVSSALKLQHCWNLCFWKFVSLHPICKIEVHLRPESFLSIGVHARYYRLPLWRGVVGQ